MRQVGRMACRVPVQPVDYARSYFLIENLHHHLLGYLQLLPQLQRQGQQQVAAEFQLHDYPVESKIATDHLVTANYDQCHVPEKNKARAPGFLRLQRILQIILQVTESCLPTKTQVAKRPHE